MTTVIKVLVFRASPCPLIGPFCGGGRAPPIGGGVYGSGRLLPGSSPPKWEGKLKARGSRPVIYRAGGGPKAVRPGRPNHNTSWYLTWFDEYERQSARHQERGCGLGADI